MGGNLTFATYVGLMNHEEIIGERFALVYSNETYQIDIVTETRLRWKRTEGENVGQGDEERYVYSRLSDDTILVTWIEADGLGLSNVLRFSDMTVTTHANMGRDVFENCGNLRHLRSAVSDL